MSATAKSFVGLWQGEHRAGFAKITIDLQSVDDALREAWVIEAGADADRPFPAIATPIANPKLYGGTPIFVPINSPATMDIRPASHGDEIFEPV